MPTPFRGDGALDAESQGRVVEAAIGWGVDGLTALGITSEAAELSEVERNAALDEVVRAAARRVPVVVGCSAADADRVVERIRRASDAGADAAMVAAPRGADPRALSPFFERAARDGGLPILVQDEPAATGVLMSVEDLVASARAADARAVKLEHPPTAPKIAAVLRAAPELAVFGGLGGVFALSELRHGAAGTMTGFAFPEILRAVRRALDARDDTGAARIFDRFLPLLQFEAQPGAGLAVRKELLRRRGAIATAAVRRGAGLDDVTASELDDVLDRTGVRPSLDPFDPA